MLINVKNFSDIQAYSSQYTQFIPNFSYMFLVIEIECFDFMSKSHHSYSSRYVRIHGLVNSQSATITISGVEIYDNLKYGVIYSKEKTIKKFKNYFKRKKYIGKHTTNYYDNAILSLGKDNNKKVFLELIKC